MEKSKKYTKGLCAYLAFLCVIASVFLAGVSAALGYKGLYFQFALFAFVFLLFEIMFEKRVIAE